MTEEIEDIRIAAQGLIDTGSGGALMFSARTVMTVLTALRTAERVCAMAGWTANHDGTEREKALTEVWMEWAHQRPHLTGPDGWPDLTDEHITALAARRDATRAATLARLFAQRDDGDCADECPRDCEADHQGEA